MEAFLTWLAAERNVAASTHGQALSALIFLAQRVLALDLPWLESIGRPRRHPRLPTVLSQDEVARLLLHSSGTHRLLAQLLYGTGMRIAEALQLRVKDLDFERRTLIVRCGKGGKDRLLMLPAALVPALREQLARARLLWSADRAAQRPGVRCPMRSIASTRALARHGPGSGCCRKKRFRSTRAAASSAGTICTTQPFSAHSRRPPFAPASTSRPHRTPCATIPSPGICRDDRADEVAQQGASQVAHSAYFLRPRIVV